MANIPSSVIGYTSIQAEPSYIDVSLNNVTATSNNIEIPVSVSTRGNNVSALQFEFVFDASKVAFEDLKAEIPNGWYLFANSSKPGVVRFGAVDRDLKTPLAATSIPFKVKFKTLQNGLDINTRVQITQNFDAADNKGNQLGINLNTTTIKITGYNNFN